MFKNRYLLAQITLLVICAFVFTPHHIQAQTTPPAERLCDASFEDCRTPLFDLIRNETVGIDVAYWTLLDGAITPLLIRKHNEGVPVRVLVDPRSSDNGKNAFSLQLTQQLAAAGIPMRKKNGSSYQHWKFMVFVGQGIVEFSGANYSELNFKPYQPYEYYNDEVIYFASDPAVVDSFKTEYENRWISPTLYTDYANITTPPTRKYPVLPIAPETNIGQAESYFNRLLPLLRQETKQIDALMFRITDERPADELIAAFNRGVSVRLMSDIEEYRDPKRLWHAYNLDRLYAAGLTIRIPKHAGQNHEKAVLLHSRGETVFGSQNWGSAMIEHNYFTLKPWFYQWFTEHFNRKWDGTNPLGVIEFKLFVPQPPPVPVNLAPADGSLALNTNLTLQWEGSPFAHKFDVLLGTDPNNLQPVVVDARYPSARDSTLPVLKGGAPDSPTPESYNLSSLEPGRFYYWQIVGKTMAGKTASSPIWNFTTAGNYPPPASPNAVTATALSAGHIKISWNLVETASFYRVERSASGMNTWTEIARLPADVTHYDDIGGGLTVGSTYDYRVRALNPSGFSNYSQVVSVMIKLPDVGTQDVVLYAADAPLIVGLWRVTPDPSAAGGASMTHPNVGMTQSAPLGKPKHYFEMEFTAQAGIPYHLWIRGKAEKNSAKNDSAYVQFSGSIDGNGAPIFRLGTSKATNYTLQGCSTCTLNGWGWEDNGYGTGVSGQPIYFQTSGLQTIRIQTWKDGLSIDQIVLSPQTFLDDAPGAPSNDVVTVPRTNIAPRVSGTATVTSGIVPLIVSFTSEASDADGSIVTLAWDFGDGSFSNDASPSHTYTTAGNYTATVTVTDNMEARTSTSFVINVNPEPPPPIPDIVLYAAEADTVAGAWHVEADPTAAEGRRITLPNLNASKISTAKENPQSYFEITFYAEAGQAYRLWMRGQAQDNSANNDSVFVQFDNSVDAAGAPVYRIGTTSSTTYNLEEYYNYGLSGWGWQDNGWGVGVLGTSVRFATSGVQRLRVQVREDGLSLDQIVLSPEFHFAQSPGNLINDSTILPHNTGFPSEQ